MSRIIEILEHPHTKMAIASLAAVAVVGGVVYYMKKNELLFFKAKPKKWRKVGVISCNMWIYPIKSCAPAVVNSMDCQNLGPANGQLRDRVFMLIRSSNHEYVNAMTYPKMVLVTPSIDENVLTIAAPGMSDITVDIEPLFKSTKTLTATLNKDQVLVVDCGDDVARWFSRYLLLREQGLRLVFYPPNEPKPFVKPKGYLYKTAERIDTGALHDETSYMLINKGSLDDLNAALERPISPLQFRPNFMVTGPAAFAEDKWRFIKIGEVVFETIQPCTRCSITTVDPTTGERNKREEPLKTLRKYRLFSNISARSPIFGIYLGLRTGGTIKTGDTVYVSSS